jgi:hypothetical protein
VKDDRGVCDAFVFQTLKYRVCFEVPFTGDEREVNNFPGSNVN